MAWKAIEGMMDGRLEGVKLHDVLHSFWQKRWHGTRIMDAKLVQQLAFIEKSAPSTGPS